MTTTKRVFPLPTKQPTETNSETLIAPSELMSIEEVAKRLGRHPNTIRRWIDQDMRDGNHRIPGGRCAGQAYTVIRAVFERAMRQGLEPEPRPVAVAAGVTEAIAELRALAAQATRIADALRDAQVLDREGLRQTG